MSTKNLKLKLTIDADGNIDGVVADVDKLGKGVGKATAKTDQMSDSLKQLRNQALAAFSIYQVIQFGQEVISLTDQYKAIHSQIVLVTASQEELFNVQKELLQISNQTRTSMEGSTKLYSAISASIKEMGKDSSYALEVIDTYNKALALTAPSAQQSASATLQFAQALGSGILRGDEFNSVMENGRGVTQALADALGLTLGEMRQLAQDGVLTSELVIQALMSQADAIEQKFSNVELTVSAATQVAHNNVIMWLGDQELITDATTKLAHSIIFMSEHTEKAATVMAFSAGALATVYAVRLIPAVNSSVKRFYAANVAGKGLLVTTKALTAAAWAFARTPIGAAVTTAAATIGYFAMQSNEAVESADDLIKRLDNMALGFKNLSAAQTRQAIAQINADMDKMRSKVFTNQDRSLMDIVFGDSKDAAAARKEHRQLFKAWQKLLDTKAQLKTRLNDIGEANNRVNISFKDSKKELSTFDKELLKISEARIKLIFDEKEAEEILLKRRLLSLDLTQEQVEELMQQHREYIALKTQTEAEQKQVEEEKRLLEERAQNYEKMVERIDGAFVDVWRNVIDGTDNAFDAIKSMFKQLLAEMAHQAITKPIVLSLAQEVGLGRPAVNASGSGNTSAGSVIQQGMDASSLLSSAGSLGTFTQVGLSAYSSGVGFGAVNEAISGMVTAGQYGNAASTAIGAYGAPVMGAITGYQANGVKGAAAGAGGAYLGAKIGAFAGPLGAAIGGAIGSMLGSSPALFGGKWRTKTNEIQFDYDRQSGLDATNYVYRKKSGGLFSSTKRRRRYYDMPEVEQAFDGVIANMLTALDNNANKLGFDLADNFSTYVATSIKGMNESQAQEAISNLVEQIYSRAVNSITGLTDFTADFAAEGEKTYETLARIMLQFESLTPVLNRINLGMGELNHDSVAIANNLVNLAGGLDVFQAQSQAYYQAFFSEAERFTHLTDDLTASLNAYNLALPTTREAYRDLVETTGVLTEQAQVQSSALIQLSSVADSYYSQLEQAEQSLNQTRLGLVEDLQSAYNKILGTTVTDAVAYTNAQTVLTDALTAAQTGGSFSVESVRDAIAIAANNTADNYSSATDFDYDQKYTAGLINQLSAYLGATDTEIVFDNSNSLSSPAITVSNGDQQQLLAELQKLNALLTEQLEDANSFLFSLAASNQEINDYVEQWHSEGLLTTQVQS